MESQFKKIKKSVSQKEFSSDSVEPMNLIHNVL